MSFINITYYYMSDQYIEKELQDEYLEQIKLGKKTYEGRLKSKIQEWKLKIGSRIKFYDKHNINSWALVEVVSLQCYNDFGKAYDALGEELIPRKSKNEVIKLYNEIYHYLDEKIDDISESQMIINNGVVAIGVNVITYRPITLQ